ncbi:MAG TPA: phage tail tube protein [Patescibacteria group bacterium]|nr:phage tail tube protein [Patescibacteria group bacterium]
MAQKGIGRLFSVGIAKETARGTAETSATYWIPFSDASIDEKFENVTQDEAYGIIEDSVGQFRVKNWAEGTLKVPLTDQSLPLLLYSIFGHNADATHSGETTVYDHTLTVGETAQHQSLTLFIHDPLSGQDYSHANGVIHKLELTAELKKFIDLSLSVKAFKGATQTSFTPSIVAENRFLPQHLTFKYATTVSGLSSATAIALKSIKLSIDESIEDDDVLGQDSPLDFLNKEFKITGQLEAIFENNTDFKQVALADPNVAQALSIDIKNTDVTIGTAANPEVAITLDKVYFTEYSRPIKVKDLVYQTVKFVAAYSVTDSEMAKIVVTNTVASY